MGHRAVVRLGGHRMKDSLDGFVWLLDWLVWALLMSMVALMVLGVILMVAL